MDRGQRRNSSASTRVRLFVGGDSAGGNLAAVVAMHARDHGGPRIRGQVLIYPVTEFAMTHASHQDPDTGVLLTHALMRWFGITISPTPPTSTTGAPRRCGWRS